MLPKLKGSQTHPTPLGIVRRRPPQFYIMPHFFRLYNKDYMINYRIKCYISNTRLCTDTFSNSKFLVDKHLVI